MYGQLETIDKISHPLERIAWNTYWWRTAQYSQARESGQTLGATQAYLNWAREYKCQGALLHPLLSCRTGTFPLLHLRNALLESVSVPSLLVQGDIVDLRVFDESQAKKEVDLFIEVMDYYKGVREQMGLAWQGG